MCQLISPQPLTPLHVQPQRPGVWPPPWADPLYTSCYLPSILRLWSAPVSFLSFRIRFCCFATLCLALHSRYTRKWNHKGPISFNDKFSYLWQAEGPVKSARVTACLCEVFCRELAEAGVPKKMQSRKFPGLLGDHPSCNKNWHLQESLCHRSQPVDSGKQIEDADTTWMVKEFEARQVKLASH